MGAKNFRAMVVSEAEEKKFTREIAVRNTDDLPEGEVLVKVAYSSLNYKDALSAIGNRGVTRSYPHTPGIDVSGVVEESSEPTFKPGDEVIVTSYDLGMNTWGGFSEYVRVPSGWVVPLPSGLTLREAMVFGTAGLTGALSVLRLTELVPASRGDILVSGATGGVGSIATSILVKLGYGVVAVNGLVDETDYLLGLGAKEVISIEDATDASGRPLLKTRWAGSIDTVGGDVLATTIKSVDMAGAVTSCGNVASPDLPLNVFPFILRGITLIGIDSQNCPMDYRRKTWGKLATDWKLAGLDKLVTEVNLEGLSEAIDLMIGHKNKGRTIVRIG